jgi:hypothetical protein
MHQKIKKAYFAGSNVRCGFFFLQLLRIFRTHRGIYLARSLDIAPLLGKIA